jgi:3-deoxy-7-phosphoheptulonate synthase
MKPWSPSSWRDMPAAQQPLYPDAVALRKVESQLDGMPPLVSIGEVDALRRQLAKASRGEAFLLQGGDCAESFSQFSAEGIQDLFKVLMQMAVVLAYAGSVPVVKVGRLAGQFAKPRSADFEEKQGQRLPSYRGDIINDIVFHPESRRPDPARMLQAYHQSTATMNLVRAYSQGGLADLHKVSEWNLDFVSDSAVNVRYQSMAQEILKALRFMQVCGVNSDNTPSLHETHLYTSHEALLLNYEQSLLQCTEDGRYYCGSAHMLWIGERTRQLDGAHVEFLRGVANPIGVKVSDKIQPDELLALVRTLNPDNEAGRLTLISRMGADRVEAGLPALVEAVVREGLNVVWSCDPMHGNTKSASNGMKTRSFDAVCAEVLSFFKILRQADAHAGGVHLEMTGAHVTECVGGAYHVGEDDLALCYTTQCDPRLNAQQVLELAFALAAEIQR